jgi:hypothetical protein
MRAETRARRAAAATVCVLSTASAQACGQAPPAAPPPVRGEPELAGRN